MFFMADLCNTIYLPPIDQTSNIRQTIENSLYKTVEGTCSSENGFIVSVIKITAIEGGKITHTGYAQFVVSFKALLLKPHKNEVLDTTVADVNNLGVFCSVGPLVIFVSNFHIPSGLQGSQKLEKDDILRVRVIGTKIDKKRVYAIGTINDDCLGILNNKKLHI